MTEKTAAFLAKEWQTDDGLTLTYRDYPGGTENRPILLCLHGLTRNARDFAPVADRFAGEWRLLVPEMCGRGESEYARDPARYTLPNYVRDVTGLLRSLDAEPVAILGTSMGGLMAMKMAQSDAWPIVGVALNDIGPELDPAGAERIREHVGQGGSFETWMHAARHLREAHGPAHPGFALSDWLAYAKRVMCVGGSGRIAFDYDMKIAEPFDVPGAALPLDLWPAYRALAGKPLLLLRGALSDLLSAATFARMQAEIPEAEAVTVPQVGHPPTLDEPESLAAIGRWLGKLA